MSFKDTIRCNKTNIIAILSGDYRLILNKVHEKELITLREYNNLKDINKENVEGHVVELVDKIMNKDEEICQRFLNLLQTDDDIKGAFPKLEKLPLGGHPPLSQPVQASSSHSEVHPPANNMKNKVFYEPKSHTTNINFFMNRDNFDNGSVSHTINQYAGMFSTQPYTDIQPVKKAMKRNAPTKAVNPLPKKTATIGKATTNAVKNTPKKAATRKPATKKTVAKKRPAKKPAVRKPAAKNPATKKPAAKKSAAKKPATKKAKK